MVAGYQGVWDQGAVIAGASVLVVRMAGLGNRALQEDGRAWPIFLRNRKLRPRQNAPHGNGEPWLKPTYISYRERYPRPATCALHNAGNARRGRLLLGRFHF